MRLKLSLLMFWNLGNLRNGFAARCAAVASPRRSASTLARAVPLVRALPSLLSTKAIRFHSALLSHLKETYASTFSYIQRLARPLHHCRNSLEKSKAVDKGAQPEPGAQPKLR